jgi:hypothetical protein
MLPEKPGEVLRSRIAVYVNHRTYPGKRHRSSSLNSICKKYCHWYNFVPKASAVYIHAVNKAELSKEKKPSLEDGFE